MHFFEQYIMKALKTKVVFYEITSHLQFLHSKTSNMWASGNESQYCCVTLKVMSNDCGC